MVGQKVLNFGSGKTSRFWPICWATIVWNRAAVASFAKTSTLYAVIVLVLAAGTVALLIKHAREDKDNGMR